MRKAKSKNTINPTNYTKKLCRDNITRDFDKNYHFEFMEVRGTYTKPKDDGVKKKIKV